MIKIVLIILGVFFVLVVSSYTIGDIVFTKKAKEEVNEIFRDDIETIPEI